MTLEVVLVVTHVEKMAETVIMMVNVKMVTNVELTIAGVLLALNPFMIAASVLKKIFAQLKFLAV